MSLYPFSGVELRGQVHPQKFWFVEISGEIPENSGTEVSTRLLTIALSDIFLRKKQHFWSSASVRIAEHEKSRWIQVITFIICRSTKLSLCLAVCECK